MYSACIAVLLGYPTTCTLTGTIPNTVNLVWLATLMMVDVGMRCFSSRPILRMMFFPAQITEAPVSAIPVDLVALAVFLSGMVFGCGCRDFQ